jgi:hypothetical protein
MNFNRSELIGKHEKQLTEQACVFSGQSNSPNNSDLMPLKQVQCCQLGGLKYIYSEILTLDVQNKKRKKMIPFFTNTTQFWLHFSKQHRPPVTA